MQGKKPFQPLTSNEVCEAYNLLHREGYVSFPITEDAVHKIETIVTNVTAIYFGQEAYVTHEEKAVAYLYFLINDHPFTDGNKRTAVIVFAVVCAINGIQPKFNAFSLDELALYIERTSEPHQDVIRDFAKLLTAAQGM